MQYKNPLLCDIESGVCAADGTNATASFSSAAEAKPIKIVYFTDPICSSCWGIEPQLRRMKLEYRDAIEIEYHMGGLLKDWTYNSGGISKPSDVAHHWDEVSHHYEMPIDGDVWLEDPLPSSYPPSIAFKAAEIQDRHKSILFLRRMREMVFLEKKNITKWPYLKQAAEETGLDPEQLKEDFAHKAISLFKDDLALAQKMGVRGFPTFFFTDNKNQQQILYGARPYTEFESKLKALLPGIHQQKFENHWTYLFHRFATLTTKEYEILTNKTWQEAENELETLFHDHYLNKFSTKNGVLWKLK